MDVVSSLYDGLLGGVFVSGVVVYDRDGAFFADVSIDVELVKAGISDVELRLDGGMESLDLLSVASVEMAMGSSRPISGSIEREYIALYPKTISFLDGFCLDLLNPHLACMSAGMRGHLMESSLT